MAKKNSIPDVVNKQNDELDADPPKPLGPPEVQCVAAEEFFDTVLTKLFKKGQPVEGWTAARVQHYLERGLIREVHIVHGPSEVK